MSFIAKLNDKSSKLKAKEAKEAKAKPATAIPVHSKELLELMLPSFDKIVQSNTPTESYNKLQQAFDYYNQELFHSKLPPVMITLQHHKKFLGYHWKDKFNAREGELKVHEIALNPDFFRGRSDSEILSTLVHEMAHLWQHFLGKPSKPGYHNTEWAEKMKALGLHPSNTGEPGGKETGEKMSHYIVANGPFNRVTIALLERKFKLDWQSYMDIKAVKAKKQTRAKFVCPDCELAAWAKPDAKIGCFDCSEETGELQLMIKQDNEEER